MAEVYIHGEMADDMKANINLIRNMETEFIFGQMEEVCIYII